MEAGDWISAAATVLAAASFIWGVVSWRASYLGQKKIELAEQVYELFLKCADHIRAIRSPMGYVGEGQTRQRGTSETPDESENYDRAYVALERIENRKDDFNKLFSLMPRFDFYFGEQAIKPIREIGDILFDIRKASNKLRHYWVRQGKQFRTDAAFQEHLAKMQAAETVFWETDDDDDPIAPRLKAATTHVKETCAKAINPRVNLWWAFEESPSANRGFCTGARRHQVAR